MTQKMTQNIKEVKKGTEQDLDGNPDLSYSWLRISLEVIKEDLELNNMKKSLRVISVTMYFTAEFSSNHIYKLYDLLLKTFC